eukprot:COSAG05_NODE_20415_length_279_cov_1.138889_1_plen_59_part_10
MYEYAIDLGNAHKPMENRYRDRYYLLLVYSRTAVVLAFMLALDRLRPDARNLDQFTHFQ